MDKDTKIELLKILAMVVILIYYCIIGGTIWNQYKDYIKRIKWLLGAYM